MCSGMCFTNSVLLFISGGWMADLVASFLWRIHFTITNRYYDKFSGRIPKVTSKFSSEHMLHNVGVLTSTFCVRYDICFHERPSVKSSNGMYPLFYSTHCLFSSLWSQQKNWTFEDGNLERIKGLSDGEQRRGDRYRIKYSWRRIYLHLWLDGKLGRNRWSN